MGLLDSIFSPQELKNLPADRLEELAAEIRTFLVESVSKTGGHLGSNLGVVELTIALHRVFNSPQDAIIFDTGHQSYVHKLLTGRHDFSKLKKQGGLSGYPSRAESDHDVVESSHASSSLSWAEGIAKARMLSGQAHRHTVAVIGDGALTGGMTWEALNNIAVEQELPLLIVVNDNERSYAPTIGGLADHLAALRTTRSYEWMLDWGKSTLQHTPVVGDLMYDTLHGVKKGIKDIVAPQQGMFEDLGIKYVGPVDGHDITAIGQALRRAKSFGHPCIVHAITEKGRGYQPALDDQADHMHGIGKINPEIGLPCEVSGRIWTDEFNDELVRLGGQRSDLVAITAAMMIPVGLDGFAAAYPERVLDVGIAEQHAVTMASGLAYGGMHPIVAIYATFLNRAFDQMLMDAALHKAGVTFVLDRAGVTGADGSSHNGMWDMSLCSIVPGLRLAAPRDSEQVKQQLREALDVDDAPTVIRFPKGDVSEPLAVVRRDGTLDVLYDAESPEVLVIAVGAMCLTALMVAEKLAAQGNSTMVVDPRWVLPVPADLVNLAASVSHVVVIEDNLVTNGVGVAVGQALQTVRALTRLHTFGIPKEFLEHASRDQVFEAIGLTPDIIATELISRLDH